MNHKALCLSAATLFAAAAAWAGATTPLEQLRASAGPGAAPAIPAVGAAADIPSTPSSREKTSLAIMRAGSLGLSQTVLVGRRFYAGRGLSTRDIAARAQRNFMEAARLVVRHAGDLPLTLETAVRLNKIVTRGLVPERIRGNEDFRGSQDVARFYTWLQSAEGSPPGSGDPVALAERIHYEISRLDAFPDGNGRTARLMADLALIRAGRAPALYTGVEEYFKRGNSSSAASREEQIAYFRQAAERGQAAAADPRLITPEAPDRATLSAIRRHPAQYGKSVPEPSMRDDSGLVRDDSGPERDHSGPERDGSGPDQREDHSGPARHPDHSRVARDTSG